MRRRILVVALSAVTLAILLLGIPLGIAIQHNTVTQQRGELERVALKAAAVVSPTYRRGDPVELPAVEGRTALGLYTTEGQRVAGTGPTTLDTQALAGRDGHVVQQTTGDALVEVLPVSVGERVIGLVRASSPRSEVLGTVVRDMLALAGLAVLAFLGAAGFAYWQSRRLVVPMRELAGAATDLGAGDFSVRPSRSGVPEIDRTSAALAVTAERLAKQMARERAFAAQASHQLRTPLTRLRLELEAGLHGTPAELESAAEDALVSADHLTQTIDDLLLLAREPAGEAPVFDVERLLADCVAQWQGTFASYDRPLRLVIETPASAAASPAAVRQILHVLIDNAYRHGQGTVTMALRESGGAVAIDVVDRGGGLVSWPSVDGSAQRMGLAMARSLAESQHGRLMLDGTAAETRFTLLIPRAASSRVG